MLAVAGVLILGIRESARTNTVMVLIKLGVLILFIVARLHGVDADNLSPFVPTGFSASRARRR